MVEINNGWEFLLKLIFFQRFTFQVRGNIKKIMHNEMTFLINTIRYFFKKRKKKHNGFIILSCHIIFVYERNTHAQADIQRQVECKNYTRSTIFSRYLIQGIPIQLAQ